MSFWGQEYISRANIKVINPDFGLEAVIKDTRDSVIYITNNSASEINLKGWQLRTKRRTFTMEADTIVLSEKIIPLSQKVTNIELWDGEGLELLYPSGWIYTVIKARKEVILVNNQSGVPNSTSGEVATSSITGDKGVDNPVDKEGTELWIKELSSLEEQLKTLQSSLVANVYEPKILPIIAKIDKVADNIEITVEKVATSTNNGEKIVILPQKRESTFWNFVKGVFGH